ncbi:hypothetical protein ISCGN_010045 [Ixodes scapularis]
MTLQEPKRLAKLSGYKSYGKDVQDKTLVTTMVKRNIPVIEHETGVSTVDHVLIEIISHEKKDRRSIFVLNVYSSPSKRHRFASLFKATTNIAKGQTLLVAGDFNAPHPGWGYQVERIKGRNLWNDSHEYGLSLITDPDQPTRRGNYRNQDTTPDLTFVKGTEDSVWSNTRHEGGEADLEENVRKRYIGNYPRRQLTTYRGEANALLDEDITEYEVADVIRGLKTKSAPGPDGVTNKMLRDLDTEAVAAITRFLNKCWQKGKIPRQWKAAKVVMIPKPGKRPELEALRPISLTSCVGKLMEHVILNRLNNYMERKQLFPHTMIGFRPHLSTQDIMLRLKHQIIDGEQSSRLVTRAILGLDITKAFDNVKHDAVLENLEMLGVGARTHDYIQDFLNDRTAQISIGGATSDDIMLGGRGTPQGSVLSPYLFNVAMIGLPKKLETIGGLHYSIYADDITLWVTGGSDGFIQDTLQEAIRVVESYVEPRGLACSPQKSELLLLKPISVMNPKEWYATLMIDEMQLTTSLVYDASSGTVLGRPTLALADGTVPYHCCATHGCLQVIEILRNCGIS